MHTFVAFYLINILISASTVILNILLKLKVHYKCTFSATKCTFFTRDVILEAY